MLTERRATMWVAIGSGIAVVVGSMLPWATVGPFSIAGTAGDGQITLVLGLAAGGLFAVWGFGAGPSRLWFTVATVAFLGSAIVALYDIGNITSLADDGDVSLFTVSVGGGLYLTAIGAFVGCGASAQRIYREWRR